MRATLCSALAGVLFGSGLMVAGMTDPAKVLAFFDFAAIAVGGWDPSLAVVMAVALAVTVTGYRLSQARQASPFWADRFVLPDRTDIDRRLLGGAVLFGLGWGLAGFCPGPALVSTAAGAASAAVFSVAMAAGMVAWAMLDRALTERRPVRA